MKIALISHVLPPSWSGQAMVIYRMLRDFTPESYCLISRRAGGIDDDPTQYLRTLSGRRYQIPPEFQLQRGFRYGVQHINMPLAIIERARYIAGVLRRERCGAAVACTGDVADLPATCLASWQVGVPFYAYIFDHYSKREWVEPVARAWAKRLEPWLLRRAAGVIVPNEILRDDLFEDYGVKATVIHNSCDIAAYESSPPERSADNKDGVSIVYTGDVYEAHFDAFVNLLEAIRKIGRPDIKLHLYTARPVEFLENYDIQGPVVRHPHHQPSEMPGIQQRADVLFLPLAFDSPYPDLVRTSATTKLGEYLAARRPILVHAPPDSFISWYFRRHQCGQVVDRNDPAELARALELLLSDAGLRERLSERAWERAREDFSLSKARTQFAALLGLDLNQTTAEMCAPA
ncbi:MAG: glycosyltransferase [Acidobacteria bacterium]|nr:glycosyltransferase [Acidobacteriota bacterium]